MAKSPAEQYVADLVEPRRSHRLALVWQALGLDGEAVAKQLRREGSKQRGTTPQRVYQLLDGSDYDRLRVLDAIETAALRRGRTRREVLAATKAIAPEVIGRKPTNTSPVAGYVEDMLSGAPRAQG